MALSKWTREALAWRANICSDESVAECNELPVQADYARCEADCEAAIAEDRLEGHQEAAEELAGYLDGDISPAEHKAINVDLARAGYLHKFDPNAVCTRRERTVTVDGVKFIKW